MGKFRKIDAPLEVTADRVCRGLCLSRTECPQSPTLV